MQPLTHRERLEACLAGEQPDRVPVALWRHFPVDDQSPEGLAAATAAFQRIYDFDLLKVTPPSSFCLKDYGTEDQWKGNTEGTRDYTKRPIEKPEDWTRLPILNPKRGELAKQINCLRILSTQFDPQLPIIQTIFSPLSQAKNLVGSEMLLVHLRKYPDEISAGLERLTQTTINWIEELTHSGIDGVFYAVQQAQYGILSEIEYQQFGKKYDIRVLRAAQIFWLNMLHLHGENVMFDLVSDYPVGVINWHDKSTQPSLNEAQQQFSGVVCGGLKRWETMVLGNAQDVGKEAKEAIQATGGKRFILGTGCVLPIIAPHGNILAARQAVSGEETL